MSSTFKKGRSPVYETDLKIAIAREYLTSDLGYGKLAAKHGLPLRTVLHFVTWYKKNYPELTAETSIPSPGLLTLDRSEGVEKKLKDANLKIAALEMLIEEASKELGVDLVKKFGTKRSKK